MQLSFQTFVDLRFVPTNSRVSHFPLPRLNFFWLLVREPFDGALSSLCFSLTLSCVESEQFVSIFCGAFASAQRCQLSELRHHFSPKWLKCEKFVFDKNLRLTNIFIPLVFAALQWFRLLAFTSLRFLVLRLSFGGTLGGTGMHEIFD